MTPVWQIRLRLYFKTERLWKWRLYVFILKYPNLRVINVSFQTARPFYKKWLILQFSSSGGQHSLLHFYSTLLSFVSLITQYCTLCCVISLLRIRNIKNIRKPRENIWSDTLNIKRFIESIDRQQYDHYENYSQPWHHIKGAGFVQQLLILCLSES